MNVSSPPPALPGPNASVPVPAGASLALPRTFGRYTLFELIGKGGMAEIYLARAETDLGATRLSVVKQILPAFSDDPRFEAMLTHEAKLAARLSHARVVQVFDLGRADGHLFIAMEYVEGFDLNALLRQCTEKRIGLPVEHALGIVADVLEGLDYAHRLKGEDGKPLGLVHRDVSPSNVLISYEGEVKLCDFGIAHANDLVREGASEALKGKAGYMSPEHAQGEPLDARADVFAAGIVLWELLAGHRLYRPKGELPLLEQARRAEIPPLPEKGLPNAPDLEKIVQRALARDREERYPSALAMLRDLEAYLAKNGLLASRLKLGEWMSASFGTGLVEQRRASERRLPKSTPPRSSDRVRTTGATSSSLRVGDPASSSAMPVAAPVPELEPAPAPAPASASDLTPSDLPPAVRAGVVALAAPMGAARDPAPPPVTTEPAPVPEAPKSAPAEGSSPRISELPDETLDDPTPRARPISLVPISSGAMRAFKRELADARAEQSTHIAPPSPESLAAVDVSPSSDEAPSVPASRPSEGETITVPRRRALLAFLAIMIAVAIVVALAMRSTQ